MSATTSIEWTDRTWNPVRGCSVVSAGCKNCYAMSVAARFSGPGQAYEGLALRSPARWTGEVRVVGDALTEPLSWRKPCRVFVNSMSDLFHEALPEAAIKACFTIMASCPRHLFIVLTKRAKRMCGMTWEEFAWPLPNVILGVSVEDQTTADERIPYLLGTMAARHMLSAEPLLGPLDLGPFLDRSDYEFRRRFGGTRWHDLDWIVTGGESGRHFRACAPEWIESIAAQCEAADVPCFVKQDSGRLPGKQGRLSDALWRRKAYPVQP